MDGWQILCIKSYFLLFFRPDEFFKCQPPMVVNETTRERLGHGCSRVSQKCTGANLIRNELN